MEALLVLVIILVLGICIGAGLDELILFVSALALLTIATMFIFFSYALIRLALSRRCEAEFAKLDKNPKSRFRSAYYKVDGKEYPCIFPCEALIKKRIYTPDKRYVVRLDKSEERVFDRFAVLTCIIGFIFSLAAVAFAAGIIIWLVNFGGM